MKRIFLFIAAISLLNAANANTLLASLKSVSTITFGPANTLFVGDSETGYIYSFNVGIRVNATAGDSYNLKGIDKKIAAYLGTTPENILVKGMAVDPQSQEAFLAIHRGNEKTYVPVILIVNQKGKISRFDYSKAQYKKIKAIKAFATDFSFYGTVPVRTLTFTCIKFFKNNLYVSGVSNADFNSTLTVIPYPFKGNYEVTDVSIYHANHNQMETRAPMRAFTIRPIDGKDYIIGAYTCTPLVLIPLDALKNGAKITGKTIGEMGYGNTPIDLITFTTQDMQKNSYDVILLSNKNQSAQVVTVADISKANAKPGLNTWAQFKPAGVEFFPVPMAGIIHLDNQDDSKVLSLRRNAENGNLEMVSSLKGLYYRTTDFESEFEFPDYRYTKAGMMFKGIQDMMKKQEDATQFIKK